MIPPKVFFNNVLVNPPKNWRELAIEVNFEDSEFKNQQITINDWDFVRENIDIINDWILAGFIFEGLPFRMEQMSNTGVTTTFFNGYIDCSDETIFDEFVITAKSKPKYSIDWLNDVATGFTFDYLYQQNIIVQSDFVSIPYVISSIPDYEKLAITVIGLTLILQSLVAASNDLTAAISAVASGSMDWGNIFILIGAIIKFTALLLASIALVKRMFAVIIQKVKYHKAISIQKLFERGCYYLGLQFASTMINPKDHILPAKYYVPKNPSNPFDLDILGAFSPGEFVQYGFPQGTFADFIIKQKDRYNGKVLFDGNTLRFERRDYSLAVASYQLPNIINTQFRLNTNEFTSNLNISFATDLSENNTITQYLGTGFQVTLKPQSIINPQYVLMKGLKQVNIDYALGKRKTELTTVERLFDEIGEAIDVIVQPTVNVLNTIISTINDVIDFINDVIGFFEDLAGLVSFDFDGPEIPSVPTIQYEPLGELIDDRIGMLLLQNDSFLKDKLVRIESDGKLSTTQPSARECYELFYIIDYFTQYKLQDWNGIGFTLSNFNSVQNNPQVITPQGATALVMSCQFNIWDKKANIKTKTPYIYTTNLIKNEQEPTGE